MKKLTSLSLATLCIGIASLGFTFSMAEAAPFPMVPDHLMNGVRTASPLIHKAHSKMHGNCALHSGICHNHRPTNQPPRRCLQWMWRPGPQGSRERICTKWSKPKPRYYINVCPRQPGERCSRQDPELYSLGYPSSLDWDHPLPSRSTTGFLLSYQKADEGYLNQSLIGQFRRWYQTVYRYCNPIGLLLRIMQTDLAKIDFQLPTSRLSGN